MKTSLLLQGILLFHLYGFAEKPNVLFIAADDLSCALGCYGDPIAKTPHLDRLAANGVCFLKAYNQLPLCNPTRASVMTGLRPDTIKVYDLDRHFRDEVPEAITLSQQFMKHGWWAGRVGKIYHYNVPASIGTDGFDDPPSWQRTINPKGRDKTDEALIFNAEPHRKISAALSWLAADGRDEEQTDGMVATEAIRLMEEKRKEPFFIAAGFFRPHTPYVAPKKYFDMYPLKDLRLPYAPPTIGMISPPPPSPTTVPFPITAWTNSPASRRCKLTTHAFLSWTRRSDGCWMPSTDSNFRTGPSWSFGATMATISANTMASGRNELFLNKALGLP